MPRRFDERRTCRSSWTLCRTRKFYPSTNPNWSAAQGAFQSLIGQIGQGKDPADVLGEIQAQGGRRAS